MSQSERVNFGSKLGVILATAGSAVGLGNVWRFPYMTGQNGGAAFILVYLGCVLLLGIPGMISEFIIGRHAASNTARAYRKLSNGTPWMGIGYIATTAVPRRAKIIRDATRRLRSLMSEVRRGTIVFNGIFTTV